jgi:chromosome segregation ATPase
MKSEKELLATHTEWLNGELKAKSAELMRVQSEQSSEVTTLQVCPRATSSHLQQTVESLQSEKVIISKSLSTLKEQNEDLHSKFDHTLQKVADLKEQLALQEDQFRDELNKKERLISSFTEKSTEDDKKILRLEHSVAVCILSFSS